MSATAQWMSGAQYDVTASSSWSSDGAAATVSSGTVNGISGGTVYIISTFTDDVQGTACSGLEDPNGDPMECPIVDTFEAQSPANVEPHIDSISPNAKLVGSNSVQITINGKGFGTSPTVNLPSGFTKTAQSNGTDSQFSVTVNIGFTAMIGNSSISVSTQQGMSNGVQFTADGPAKMVVQTDTLVPIDQPWGTQARDVAYIATNFSGSAAANIPIAEDFSYSRFSCDQLFAPSTVACNGQTHTDTTGKFIDEWQLFNLYTPVGCGLESIVDHWQWCGSSPTAPNPGIPFGTLKGFAHTNDIQINGFDNPAAPPLAGPMPMPPGTVIKP